VPRNRCVLIVDDRAGNREFLASALRAEAYETREAQTIDHAVKLIASAAIDVVLTDVCIDRNDDGLTLLRQIKAARPLLPVVLYTAYGVVPDAVLAMKLGATDYLECPLETDLVVSTIRHALGITPIAESPTPFIDTEARLSASARWARYVLKAVSASEDPKTLRDWARCAATSYTSLREACYLLAIQPEDARDFVRALRVVVGLSNGAQDDGTARRAGPPRAARILAADRPAGGHR
jgi:CheY-like chemotaxis protein